MVRELADSTARLLGTSLDPERILVDDRFVGPGYAEASEDGKVATQVFAEQEGILLEKLGFQRESTLKEASTKETLVLFRWSTATNQPPP